MKKAEFKDGLIHISFNFPKGDPQFWKIKDLVAKELPESRYNSLKYEWTCMLTPNAINRLQSWNFELGLNLRSIFANNISKEINPSINVDLYPFQKETIALIEQFNGRALLSDQMGCGKTIESLGWVSLHQELRPILVVCPATIKIKWEREIQKCLGQKKIIILSGRSSYNIDGSNEFIIINYDIIKDWLSILKKIGIKGMILDECFPYNIPINTNKGKFSIGEIVENQLSLKILSYNFFGKKLEYKKINRYIKKRSSNYLLKINYKDGYLICTPNHKIWTKENGYVEAKDIYGKTMRILSKNFYSKVHYTKILWKKLFCKMENVTRKYKTKSLYKRTVNKNKFDEKRNKKTRCLYKDENQQSSTYAWNFGENKKNKRRKWNSSYLGWKTWRKWATNRTTEIVSQYTKMENRICNFFEKKNKGIPDKLQSRSRKSRFKNCHRNRWGKPYDRESKETRQKKRKDFKYVRVESVEILERGNYERFGICSKESEYVYNLEISGNHNYFANDILVSNCHYIKNKGARRTKAVVSLGRTIDYILALSGTPIESRPSEFWTILSLLRPDIWRYKNLFEQRYCDKKIIELNLWNRQKKRREIRKIKDITGSSNEKELNDILVKTVMIRHLKKDVLPELPLKTISMVPIDIINKKDYRDAEKDIICWIRKNIGDAQARSAARAKSFTRVERLKQIAVQGKLNACVDWIKDFLVSGEKLVVFCWYQATIDFLMDEFFDVAVKLDGRDSLRKKQKSIDRFQADDSVKLFIGNIKAAGIGCDLTAASNVCFLEFSWTPSDHTQAADRCHRIGQKDNVTVWYLIAKDTVEEYIAEVIDEKRKNIDAILDGKKTEKQDLLTEILRRIKC